MQIHKGVAGGSQRRGSVAFSMTISTHEDFVTMITDTEIYVNGIATMHFKDFNNLLEVLRDQVITSMGISGIEIYYSGTGILIQQNKHFK